MDEVKQQDKEQQEELSKPSKASVLFERYMGWFVLTILAGAVWFKNTPLIVVSTFLLTISLFISLWKRKALQGLVPGLHLPKSRVFAGDQVPLACTLSNQKWLPLVWVEWELPYQEGLSWNERDKENYLIRLLWLLGHRRVTWEIEGLALHRGVYSVGQLLLRSGDAFRFSETESQVDLIKDLYVYPKLLPVHAPSLITVFQWGMSGKKGGMLEDLSQISGIREYQSGDEWRKIHWQASARTGSLKTWVYQPIVPRQLIMGIDVAGYNRDNESFEWFLSVIASLGIAYNRQGIRLGHACNALDRRGIKIRSMSFSKSITPLMDDLAKMTSQINKSHDSLWEELRPKGKALAPVFYFCHHIEERHVQWVKKHKKAASYVLFYYHQKTSFADMLQGQAKSMATLHPDSLTLQKGRGFNEGHQHAAVGGTI